MTTPSTPQTLPELPIPMALLDTGGGWMAPTQGFTAAQMHAYALAALAAQPHASAVPAIPEGWQIVPIEPTQEMIGAGERADDENITESPSYAATKIYLAMLEAAPPPPAGQQDRDEAIDEWSQELKHRLYNTLMHYANSGTYDAPRIGGVLQGCPRGKIPSSNELTMPAKCALADIEEAMGRVPPEWMVVTDKPRIFVNKNILTHLVEAGCRGAGSYRFVRTSPEDVCFELAPATASEAAHQEPLSEAQRTDLLTAAFYIAAKDDDSAVLWQKDAERIVDLLTELSGFDVNSIAAPANGEVAG